jgi:hypothetical protein
LTSNPQSKKTGLYGTAAQSRRKFHQPSQTKPWLSIQPARKYAFKLSAWAKTPLQALILASSTGDFHTALFSASAWQGSWISGGTLLRDKYSVPSGKSISSAVLFASGVGCFNVKLNGQDVDTISRSEPGFSTAPRMRVLYRAYDVLPLVRNASKNAIAVQLGFCKYGYLDLECTGAHGAHAACR